MRLLTALWTILLSVIAASAQIPAGIKLGRDAKVAELSLQRGPEGAVQALAFNPDGSLLATGGADNTVRVWQTATGRELRNLTGHAETVLALAFSPDGNLLASGSADNTVRVWNVATGRLAGVFSGHSERVAAVTFLDAKTFVSASYDGTMRVWQTDLDTSRQVFTVSPTRPTALAFSPDSAHLAVADYERTVKIWATAHGTRETLLNTGDLMQSLAFSPDSKILAAGGGYEKSVKLWDLTQGRKLATLKHDALALALAFSPDGQQLATNSGPLKLWRVADGKALWDDSPTLDNFARLAFSPNGQTLVTGGNDSVLRLYAAASGVRTDTWPPDADAPTASANNDTPNEWLIVTPEGLFDGTLDAQSRATWRYGPELSDLAALEDFADDFQRPNLLAEITSGQRPQPVRDVTQLDPRRPQIRLTLAQRAAPDALLTTRRLTLNVDVAEVAADSEHPASSGVRDVRLFQNGSLIKTWTSKLSLNNGRATLSTEITLLAGANRFTVTAANRDGIKGATSELTINGADSLRRTGTTHLLAIGLNRYANEKFNLRYCVNDAQLFIDEITRQQQRLGRTVNALLLTDEKATKAGILAALNQLAAQAQPEDVVLVHFAGHALAHQNHGYLMPHDFSAAGAGDTFDAARNAQMAAGGLSEEELACALASLNVAQFALTIDAANSGALATARSLTNLARAKGQWYLLTAAQTNQLAAESDKTQHGNFTYALLQEGLQQGQAASDNERTISLYAWLEYARERVAETSNGRQQPQLLAPRTPVLFAIGAREAASTR